jgi:hypothetical protein
MVCYGLTYSFEAGEEEEAGGPPARPAPLLPAIDSLHSYAGLPQPVARVAAASGGTTRPGWHKAMPLVLRQNMARLISAALITRLDQVGGHRTGG